MASRKKSDGSTSARRVDDAIRKCGTSAVQFFYLAGISEGAVRQAEQFDQFNRLGISAVPSNYKIPAPVINLTEKVLQQANPKSYFKTLQPPKQHL